MISSKIKEVIIMITQIFSQIGDTLTVGVAYSSLISLYNGQGQAYPTKKAAGSLGGSVTQGVLILNNNGTYTRIK